MVGGNWCLPRGPSGSPASAQRALSCSCSQVKTFLLFLLWCSISGQFQPWSEDLLSWLTERRNSPMWSLPKGFMRVTCTAQSLHLRSGLLSLERDTAAPSGHKASLPGDVRVTTRWAGRAPRGNQNSWRAAEQKLSMEFQKLPHSVRPMGLQHWLHNGILQGVLTAREAGAHPLNK